MEIGFLGKEEEKKEESREEVPREKERKERKGRGRPPKPPDERKKSTSFTLDKETIKKVERLSRHYGKPRSQIANKLLKSCEIKEGKLFCKADIGED